ncbi:hypothetical protein DFS34DRAFT_421320 [Phlyctochytrium arcticum]|nr:hypothetical protein DFS34DRAFT_421320 [Phlyctochytrium arcticum]
MDLVRGECSSATSSRRFPQAGPSGPVLAWQALSICLASKPSRDADGNLWAAYLMIGEYLARIRTNANSGPRSSKHVRKHVGTNTLSNTPRNRQTPKGPTVAPSTLQHPILPEILDQIFSYLHEQKDLYQCSLASRQWHRVATPHLYRAPILPSTSAIDSFLRILEQPTQLSHWNHSRFIKQIRFPCTASGSLRSSETEGCLILRKHYSSIFQHILTSSERTNGEVAHNIFFRFAALCPHLESIEELDQSPRNQTSHLVTQTILQNLLCICRHVTQLSVSCGVEPEMLAGTCVFMLEQYECESRPMWERVGSSKMRLARTVVLEKCQMILNRLSSCMFLEAQYFALSAQRLLDQYALLHYRGVAGAQDLDLDLVQAEHERQRTDTAKGGPDDPVALVLEAVQIIFRQSVDVATTPSDASSLPSNLLRPPSLLGLTETPPIVYSPQQLILEVPSLEPVETESFPSAAFLSSALMIFPPAAIKCETVELLSNIVERYRLLRQMYEDRGDEENIVLANGSCWSDMISDVEMWFGWVDDLIIWQKAGMELDGIRALLRRCMANMESFRGIQRRFGMVFID